MVDLTLQDTPLTQKHLDALLANVNKSTAAALAALHHVMETRFLNLSEVLAIEKHGIETVAAAAKAAGDKLSSFIDHHHPYDALVRAFKDGKL